MSFTQAQSAAQAALAKILNSHKDPTAPPILESDIPLRLIGKDKNGNYIFLFNDTDRVLVTPGRQVFAWDKEITIVDDIVHDTS